MEFNNVKALLDAYFEGNTTIAQEQELQDYFNGTQIETSLQSYAPLFKSFKASRAEVSESVFEIPIEKVDNHWWLSVAAAVVVVLGVTGFVYNSNNSLSAEEQQALTALKQSQEAMQLLSQNLNKGTKTLLLTNQFEIHKNKFFK